MIQIFQQPLKEHGPELVPNLVNNAGFSVEEAHDFLLVAAEKLMIPSSQD